MVLRTCDPRRLQDFNQIGPNGTEPIGALDHYATEFEATEEKKQRSRE